MRVHYSPFVSRVSIRWIRRYGGTYAPERVHNGVHIFLRVEVWYVASIQDVVDVLQHYFVHDLNVAAAEATKKGVY